MKSSIPLLYKHPTYVNYVLFQDMMLYRYRPELWHPNLPTRPRRRSYVLS